MVLFRIIRTCSLKNNDRIIVLDAVLEISDRRETANLRQATAPKERI